MESVTRKPYARQIEQERVTLRELIDTCLRNCANSYHVMALESRNIPLAQFQVMQTLPSHETYASNVLELDVHIPAEWKNDEIKSGEEEIEELWGHAQTPAALVFPARRLHHAIIELLIQRKDLEAVKIPRTLID